jgi:hypothetical protein
MFAKWFLADVIRGVCFSVAKRIPVLRRRSASNTQKLPKKMSLAGFRNVSLRPSQVVG